jgi:MoaD family protein
MAINVRYFAALREQSQKSMETIDKDYQTPKDLYQDLSERYNFSLDFKQIQVSVNGEYKQWDFQLSPNDLVVFIPPVAGG